MPEPITRTILERFDVPESGYETVVMLVETAPQVNSGLRTHPGFDSAYLLEGSLTVLEQGQQDKSGRDLDKGENYGEIRHAPMAIGLWVSYG
jgi:quercetin dioxygenase-like cupin family protein